MLRHFHISTWLTQRIAVGLWLCVELIAVRLIGEMSLSMSVGLTAFFILSSVLLGIGRWRQWDWLVADQTQGKKNGILAANPVAITAAALIAFAWVVLAWKISPQVVTAMLGMAGFSLILRFFSGLPVRGRAEIVDRADSLTIDRIHDATRVSARRALEEILCSDQNSHAGGCRAEIPASFKGAPLRDSVSTTFGEWHEHESDLDDLEFTEEDKATEDSNPASITQWLTRSITADCEVIEGGFRVQFAPGQQEAVVHLSFCPPLSAVPELTTQDLDGQDLEIRIAARLPFGTRLSIRRRLLAGEKSVALSELVCRVGFTAVSREIKRAA